MILPRYRIATSLTPGAGKGLVLDEPLARVGMIIAADDTYKVYKWNTIVATLADCAIAHMLRQRGQA